MEMIVLRLLKSTREKCAGYRAEYNGLQATSLLILLWNSVIQFMVFPDRACCYKDPKEEKKILFINIAC